MLEKITNYFLELHGRTKYKNVFHDWFICMALNSFATCLAGTAAWTIGFWFAMGAVYYGAHYFGILQLVTFDWAYLPCVDPKEDSKEEPRR